MRNLEVTVVVCSYNRAEMLRSALESLTRLDTSQPRGDGHFQYEVLVVDNASTDQTPEVVEQAARKAAMPLRTVLEKQQGVCFARNRGIQEARGEWIAFFDDDQIADSRWLAELLAMARRQETRCVGGAVRLRLPEDCPEECRSTYGELLGLSGQSAVEFKYHPRQAPGAGNLLIHRSVFEQVGVFDTTLTEAGEDSELFQRLDAAGVEGWYTPAAIVMHVIPAYRVSADYLKWRSLRQGWSLAKQDRSRLGAGGMLASLAARLVQAYALNLTVLAWETMSRQTSKVLFRRCRIWKTQGYLRSALNQLAPTAFAQQDFYRQLDFRAERQTFASF